MSGCFDPTRCVGCKHCDPKPKHNKSLPSLLGVRTMLETNYSCLKEGTVSGCLADEWVRAGDKMNPDNMCDFCATMYHLGQADIRLVGLTLKSVKVKP